MNFEEISQKNAMELSRSYHVLYPVRKLKEVLLSINSDIDLSNYTKFQIHSLYNEIIHNKYFGESKVKSLLVDYFVKENAIAAFEIKTFNGRLDFLRINGESISYEIKSEVDNLNKLEKQIHGYLKLFEYNYIVIAANHLSKIRILLPKEYGILVIKDRKLFKKRNARKNKLISSGYQLKLFTKKELTESFELFNMDLILKNYSSKEINKRFKAMLKRRYFKKWEFLTQNMDQILPVDYQYFYHHNISPSIIYGR